MAVKVTESINLGRGFTAKNRTLLAAMTNKQSNSDGTYRRKKLTGLLEEVKVVLESLPPQQPMSLKKARAGKGKWVFGAIIKFQA